MQFHIENENSGFTTTTYLMGALKHTQTSHVEHYV